MSDIDNGPIGRHTAAECRTFASADRERSEAMDTRNGGQKFEDSAASWDASAELLGRLEASFAKRELLDAASAAHVAAVRG